MNHAPILTKPFSDLTATTGEFFSWTLPAETFTDEDAGDTLNYSIERADHLALPSFLEFDPSTGTLSGTPDVLSLLEMLHGPDETLVLTATDSEGATASVSFRLTIALSGEWREGTDGADRRVQGTALDDYLWGKAGNDRLRGLDGNDGLEGGAGNDTLVGGRGNDFYMIEDHGDRIVERAGEGIDTVMASVSCRLAANVENLILQSNMIDAHLKGTGNGLANHLTGSFFADVLNGGGGIDSYAGRDGDDTYLLDHPEETVTEVSDGGTDTVRLKIDQAASYVLPENVENLVILGRGAVEAAGNAGSNGLTGNSKPNVLAGLGGDDVLSGGGGNDQLTGGEGADGFVFDARLKHNVDQITDFKAGVDEIRLDHRIFMALKVGDLSAAELVSGITPQAHDGDDRILYDTASGALFYDADGNGSGSSIQFATVENLGVPVAILQAADFTVI